MIGAVRGGSPRPSVSDCPVYSAAAHCSIVIVSSIQCIYLFYKSELVI